MREGNHFGCDFLRRLKPEIILSLPHAQVPRCLSGVSVFQHDYTAKERQIEEGKEGEGKRENEVRNHT